MKNSQETPKSKRGAHLKAFHFKKGQSGNPKGRPPLPDEIKRLKEEALAKAIELLHQEVTDPKFRSKLKAQYRNMFLETTFDRFGLPKVTKAEVTGADGAPLVIKWEE